MLPRITLITPSFQQAPFLEECLTSVHSQGYPNLEHFVVDGGSTDGSKAIIERHAASLAWWCSEPDRGQSHAINKGLERATGEVFGWLNSDDVLLPGALQRIGETFAADPNLLVLSGARVFRSGTGDRVLPLDDPSDPEQLFVSPRINQQSTFYRMGAVREVGSLEERLHYVMDYELWQQVLFRRGTSGVRIVPWELAVFRSHAESKTTLVPHLFLDELASLLHDMCAHTDLVEYGDVLAAGHRIVPLRGVPVNGSHRERVRAMTVHFLLKWHHTIHSQRDFRMMRMFRSKGLPTGELSAVQRERLARLDDQLRAPGWLGFRLRRKWKHLRG